MGVKSVVFGVAALLAGVVAFAWSDDAAFAETKPAAAPAAKPAESSDISLKAVKILIGETITLIPSEITKPDGTVVKFDKSDLNKIIVPYEDAVRIIKVANMSAEANLCEMPEVEAMNWDALRISEINKKKWTDQQLFFINRLHFLVVVTRTGQYKVTGDGDKQAETLRPKLGCSEAQKNDIRNKLEAYWTAEEKKRKS
ncbi:MAG: hypothetical protein NW215_15105 [Hyphomicrobiales bacterium]|nr:hypothetical protein [Hyphomicrobiales bacterium]